MKAVNLKKEWLQLLILAVPFCAVALLWDRIPGWVPIHWNARGQVDGMEKKTFGMLLLPCINVLAALLMGLLPLIDPKLRKLEGDMRASLWRTVRTLRLGITLFVAVTSCAMLAAALGMFKDNSQFTHIMNIGVAMLFVVLGNLMTKLRPNYLIGIRTPWTLESKEVWARTHRVGGGLFVAGGLLMIVLSFVVPLALYIYCVLLPITIGVALFTTVYSYLIYKRQGPDKAVVS
ncbi:MAG: hypothetical protein JWM68_5791 [Verrucomicrobiales bacterium]|nr:hypothetical protein [Verrucomicrobiales bacterium]